MARKPARASDGKSRRVTYDVVRELGFAFPGVEDSTSYGTPALKVQGKLIARLKEDGATLVVIIGFEEREKMLAADPQVFYLTDHYLNYPTVLVRLDKVRRDVMRRLLELAWRRRAPKRLVARPTPKEASLRARRRR